MRRGGTFVFVARVQGQNGWVWTRGRGVAQTDESGRVVSMYGTHQDITETKQAELALEDHVRQNTLMQAVATAANQARTLTEVLGQARNLVLLHDDWERARAFVPNEDATGVVPLYVTEEDRQDDLETPDLPALDLELANRAFKERASVWDDANLTAYLRDPKAVIPKGKMAFPGLKKDEDVANVIAYLKADPKP